MEGGEAKIKLKKVDDQLYLDKTQAYLSSALHVVIVALL
jgi:hypothetical protein